MKTRKHTTTENPNENLPVVTDEEDWHILQGYYDESWFPCKIIRRAEELPEHHRNLWNLKEDKFGTEPHEVVFWFEDNPPTYSILPRNCMRGPNQKLKSDAARDKDLNTAEPLQDNDRPVVTVLEEKNKLEDDVGAVMESVEENQQVLKETRQSQDATDKRLAVLEAKCEMATQALKKEQARFQKHEAEQLKHAEERGALKEEIKRLCAHNKHMAEEKERALGELRKDKEDIRRDKVDLREQVKILQRENAKLVAELEKKDVFISVLKAKLPHQCDDGARGSDNPETPKRSHSALQCAENDDSTVEKARGKRRLKKVEVLARMAGVKG